jgi:hypothetical protein
MDRSNLRLAAKLLAKAQDTQFEAEASALAEKAYVLLAEFLNGVDDAATRTGRRRERRLLQDRRSGRRLFSWRSSASRSSVDPEQRYQQGDRPTDEQAGGDIDLRA